jgi:hypothetical protein
MKKYLLIAASLFGISSTAKAQSYFIHENSVGNLQDESGRFVAWKGSNKGIGYISADNSFGSLDTSDPRKKLVSPR